MTKINIITPTIKANAFTGGTLCILEHAAQLVARGHDVRVIPSMPSPYPNWFKKDLGEFIVSTKKELLFKSLKALFEAIKCIPKMGNTTGINQFVLFFGNFMENIALTFPKFTPPLVRISLRAAYLRDHMREADITIATSYDTVIPTALIGTGKLFYFMQHYEPYFKDGSLDPFVAEKESLLSYKLGFQMIANSIWLKQKISQQYNINSVVYCPNAIALEIFNRKTEINKSNESKKSITIISYGGRDVEWKGFKDMAQAMRIARQALPNMNIIWQVYGGALLPPNNNISEYIDLGFLTQNQLATAYQQADILLSASWYESFPLFPLEAMASKLAVISTQIGTESFCIHEETAEVPTARDPRAISESIIRLIKEPNYRNKIAIRGYEKAQIFSWKNAGDAMEKILHAI